MRLVLACCILIAGCDNDRIAKLEKGNADLKAKVERQSAAVEYDLQARCAKDARAWFNLNWTPRDKNTTYLDYTNHYNSKLNACFIMIGYNFELPQSSNWHNTSSLWNVYENEKYGEFGEGHYYDYLKPGEERSRIVDCTVTGTKCNSQQEFNNLVRQYMND